MNRKNPHCLRSKKLNEEQLLLLKHFGEQPKANKSYKFIEESFNNLEQENKIINKKTKYSPAHISKRQKSFNKNKNQNSSIKGKKSGQKEKSNNKMNDYFDETNNKKKNIRKSIDTINKEENLYLTNKKNNINKSKKKNTKKNRIKGVKTKIINDNFMNKKNKVENSSKIKKIGKNKNNINNIINFNDINDFNDNIHEKIETIENKKVAIKTLINDYKIIETKEEINEINDEPIYNSNVNVINTKTSPIEILEKINFKTTQENNNITNKINTNANNNNNNIIINNINKNKNYLANIIINPDFDIKGIKPIINSIEVAPKPIQKKVYGKLINNKRVIFGVWNKPKNESPPKLIKKRRRRRRLRNILNYNKYQERKMKEISNKLIQNNEFRYIFQSNHRISKNYWHAKIDIISPKKYLGNKSQRSVTEESLPKLKIGKKRGRKKKNHNTDNDIDEDEISFISELKKNLKKTDGDVELLFNKSSIEKSSRTKSPVKQNIKSTEISSQNISKEHKNKMHFDNNNIRKSAVKIREKEFNENSFESNNRNSLNDDYENLEFFSLTSTPEAKKKLRNNFNNPKYVFPNEQRMRRRYRKRKNKDINSINNDENKSNLNDSQFSINILNDEKNQDYNNIDVDVDLSNSYYDNKNKNN